MAVTVVVTEVKMVVVRGISFGGGSDGSGGNGGAVDGGGSDVGVLGGGGVGGAAYIPVSQIILPASPTPHPKSLPCRCRGVPHGACAWTCVSMCLATLASVPPKFTKPLKLLK